MKSKRIVLDEKHVPKAEEIINQTGINNLSQLFTILLVNYGDRLVGSLRGEHD